MTTADAEAAYRFLAHYQDATLSALGEWGESERASIEWQRKGPDREFIERFVANAPEEDRDGLRTQLLSGFAPVSELPTPYETPFGYWMVRGIATQLETVIDRLALPRSQPIWFGTLPSGRVNALALQYDPVPGRFVLFETHLFTFALLFSKAVAYAFPFENTPEGGLVFSTDTAKVRRHLATDAGARAVQRFREALVAYLVEGTPSKAPAYFQESEPATLAEELRNGIEYFVMAHEYAHVLSGHLDVTVMQGGPQYFEGLGELTASELQELEADALGLGLALHALRPRATVTVAYASIEVFLSVVDVVYRGVAALRGDDTSASARVARHDSHPPPALRREHLRMALRAIAKDQADEAIRFSEGIRAAVEMLWKGVEGALVELRQRGTPLAPAWR